jgi:hypothetical protein
VSGWPSDKCGCFGSEISEHEMPYQKKQATGDVYVLAYILYTVLLQYNTILFQYTRFSLDLVDTYKVHEDAWDVHRGESGTAGACRASLCPSLTT